MLCNIHIDVQDSNAEEKAECVRIANKKMWLEYMSLLIELKKVVYRNILPCLLNDDNDQIYISGKLLLIST